MVLMIIMMMTIAIMIAIMLMAMQNTMVAIKSHDDGHSVVAMILAVCLITSMSMMMVTVVIV
jgi:hypothetical protein